MVSEIEVKINAEDITRMVKEAIGEGSVLLKPEVVKALEAKTGVGLDWLKQNGALVAEQL